MVLLLVFMQLTRDLFAIAKCKQTDKQTDAHNECFTPVSNTTTTTTTTTAASDGTKTQKYQQ